MVCGYGKERHRYKGMNGAGVGWSQTLAVTVFLRKRIAYLFAFAIDKALAIMLCCREGWLSHGSGAGSEGGETTLE